MFKPMFFVIGAVASTPSMAAVVDTFDRPNAPTLGPAYTVQDGNFAIASNQATTNSSVSLATLNGVTASSASIDAALRGFDAGSYIALSFGYDSADSYFIKIQDNDGDGVFDRYGFYRGNNDFGGPFNALDSGFTAANFAVDIVGTIATLTISANGGTQVYSRDYTYAPGSGTVGFGLNRQGVADNFAVNARVSNAVPEPATWALLIAGFGAVGGSMRRRSQTAGRALAFA